MCQYLTKTQIFVSREIVVCSVLLYEHMKFRWNLTDFLKILLTENEPCSLRTLQCIMKHEKYLLLQGNV
jgi:hypothetical protein